MVDGLVANVGIGIVPLFCSSSLAKEVPIPIAGGTDSVSLRVSTGATELGPGRLRPAFVTELGPTDLGPVLNFKG